MIKHPKIKACAQALSICSLLFAASACTKHNDIEQVDTAAIVSEVDDTVISTKVKEALLASDDVKSFAIKVRTDRGAVELSGFVNNQQQIERSIGLAQRVKGVKNVVNQLAIKDNSTAANNKISDDLVTATVKTALLNDGQLKSLEISVVTRNGEVMLSGFVDSLAQANHAVDVTQGVEGVATVLNHMTVKNSVAK